MKAFVFALLIFSNQYIFSQEKINYQTVSEELVLNLKTKKPYEKQVDILSKSTLLELTDQLITDQQKIAFWVNIYNAFIQISLSENPKLYEDRGSFFSDNRVKIAGEILSFDDIEHGIIRKSRCKLSLGYLRKPFRPKWERKLRVNNIDWRIHFALNCGAKSCPPIAIYNPKELDQQLDFMTKAYLKEQTSYNPETKTATSSVLMSWFRADFGGKSGACKILYQYKITPEEPKKLNFKNYDWTLDLGNYRELPNF